MNLAAAKSFLRFVAGGLAACRAKTGSLTCYYAFPIVQGDAAVNALIAFAAKHPDSFEMQKRESVAVRLVERAARPLFGFRFRMDHAARGRREMRARKFLILKVGERNTAEIGKRPYAQHFPGVAHEQRYK